MPDDLNPNSNTLTPDSSPTTPSEPAETPSEAPETDGNGFSDESNNIPLSNSTLTEAENEQKTEEKQAQNEPNPEPVSEPVQATEPSTAQTPVNEPLENEAETSNEQAKPVNVNSEPSLARQLLITARNAIQFRKRKKLDRVMSLFLKQSKITNDEVEKLLHVSDATATRYLSQLEQERKIKQVGKTGKAVSYSRI